MNIFESLYDSTVSHPMRVINVITYVSRVRWYTCAYINSTNVKRLQSQRTLPHRLRAVGLFESNPVNLLGVTGELFTQLLCRGSSSLDRLRRVGGGRSIAGHWPIVQPDCVLLIWFTSIDRRFRVSYVTFKNCYTSNFPSLVICESGLVGAWLERDETLD